jgi:hypothetical protein
VLKAKLAKRLIFCIPKTILEVNEALRTYVKIEGESHQNCSQGK